MGEYMNKKSNKNQVKIQFLRKTPDDVMYEDRTNALSTMIIIVSLLLAGAIVIASHQYDIAQEQKITITNLNTSLYHAEVENGCGNIKISVQVIKLDGE